MRELVAPGPLLPRALLQRGEPALDQRLLLREAAAVAAQARACRQQAQREHAEHAVRAELQRQRKALAAAAVPAQQRTGQPRRQECGELRHAGLEVVVDAQQLAVAQLHLALHALHPAGAALQLRHAHDVVEGHPQRQPSRSLARRRPAVRALRVGAALGVEHALQALHVERGVGAVLVLEHARMAERQHLVHRSRESSRQLSRQRWRLDGQHAVDEGGVRSRAGDDLEGACEATQAGLRTLARGADRRLAVLASEGQRTAGRNRAEHHRADHRAAVARHRAHVEQMVLAAVLPHDIGKLLAVDAAVAQLHAFVRGERARRRADHLRALRRGHPVADLPHRFQQLRRDQQIEAARHRIEAHHGAPAAERRQRLREDLDVIRRRAGALRNAGNRRALHRMARMLRSLDQPFAEHAAAFAAERADQDRYWSHACSARTNTPRTPSRTRSCHFGFVITSAR